VIRGTYLARPAIGAAFSGGPTRVNDRAMMVWSDEQDSSLATGYGVSARVVEAIAASGSTTNLAPGCVFSNPPPQLAAIGPPVIGNRYFELRITGIPAGSVSALLNLNVVSPLLSCGPCQILPYAVILPLGGLVQAGAIIPIPCESSLVDSTLAAQWTMFGATSCALLPGLSFSNVVAITIGS
jgi:hypothetical protein